MNKTFMRTTISDDEVHCSWYDKNGKRRAKQIATHRHLHQSPMGPSLATKLTAKETDNRYGFMPWAERHGYTIVDNAPCPHPPRILEDI